VPAAARVPERLRRAVFRGSAAVRAGLLTPNQLRGPVWRPLFTDVYVHADRPVTHALRARAAAELVVPGSVVSGASAAVLWGVELAERDDAVELTIPPGSHPRRIRGVRVRRSALLPGDLARREGTLVTCAEATALRLASALPGDEAVIAVDRLVSSGIVDLAGVRDRAERATGAGSKRARDVCLLADGLAQSPQETRLRLLLHRSPLPDPVAQFRIVVDGRFLARVDFAWPDRKVAVEYDGLWHAEAAQFARDRQRLNRLHAAGWRVVFVTAADLRDPERLLAMIADALAS
jgi:very-short-patch-repair endonuclease